MAKENEEYSLDEYLDYEKTLSDYMNNGSDRIVFNDSFVHAVMVASSIIQHAHQIKNEQVLLYCGKFSLFRDSARDKIRMLKEKIKPDKTDTVRYGKWERFNPYKSLIDNLRLFLDNNGKLFVIIEDDISGIKDEDIWITLSKYVENNQLVFKILGIPLGLNHFMVSGKTYRRENSDIEKTALCCFNDENTSNVLKKNFQILSLLSVNFKI